MTSSEPTARTWHATDAQWRAAWGIAALSAALLTYNNLFQGFGFAEPLYVPLNLAATGFLLLVASSWGLGRDDIGVEAANALRGLRLGLAVGAVVVVGLMVALAVPAFRPVLDDQRAAGLGMGALAYRALVRIPLGTALFEEMAFRGVLFGAWSRLTSLWKAAVGSSLVFGLWHIRPALSAIEANDYAAGTPGLILAAGIAVLATFAGGLFFCWLRVRSQSLMASTVAHAIVNSAALAASVAAHSLQ